MHWSRYTGALGRLVCGNRNQFRQERAITAQQQLGGCARAGVHRHKAAEDLRGIPGGRRLIRGPEKKSTSADPDGCGQYIDRSELRLRHPRSEGGRQFTGEHAMLVMGEFAVLYSCNLRLARWRRILTVSRETSFRSGIKYQ